VEVEEELEEEQDPFPLLMQVKEVVDRAVRLEIPEGLETPDREAKPLLRQVLIMFL
jgi:hypothetical protein